MRLETEIKDHFLRKSSSKLTRMVFLAASRSGHKKFLFLIYVIYFILQIHLTSLLNTARKMNSVETGNKQPWLRLNTFEYFLKMEKLKWTKNTENLKTENGLVTAKIKNKSIWDTKQTKKGWKYILKKGFLF